MSPLVQSASPLGDPAAAGLVWRECLLPDTAEYLDWQHVQTCFGYSSLVYDATDWQHVGRGSDVVGGFELHIGTDVYTTGYRDLGYGRGEHTLYKNSEPLKTLTGIAWGHSPDISLQNINGSTAWEFADPDVATVVYDGEDLRRRYGVNAAYRPYSLSGKLIFIAQRDSRYFVVYDGQRVGPDFDTIFIAYCCDGGRYTARGAQGKYLFWASREENWYIVEITPHD